MADEKDTDTTEYVLENQLHEQYAINENSRGNILISFIVGIIALFGFYGYVYLHTGNNTDPDIPLLEFLLLSIFVAGILFFLAVLSLYLGYSLRRDQVIVHKIRKKRYKESGKNYDAVFDNLYSPYGKVKKDFLLDFYNLFYWLFFWSQIFIIAAALIKYICFFVNKGWNNFNIKCDWVIILSIIIQIIFIYLTNKNRNIYYKKYEDNIKNINNKDYKNEKETISITINNYFHNFCGSKSNYRLNRLRKKKK